MCEKRVLSGNEFRLDEKIAERLVRGIGAWAGQHDLGITRQLDLARA